MIQYMPRPKRIRNLLKSVPSTPEIEHISSSSEHSVGNYVQDTSRQPSTQQGQASIQLGQPTTQPGEQGIDSADATSEPAQPLEPSQPASESSQPSSEFSQPTSQYIQPNSEAEPVINEDLAKRDVMSRIVKLWREYIWKLWNEFYDPLLSRNDLIKNVPDEITMDQWALFVDYRLKPSTMEMGNRNRDIRKRQIIPHTGGAMSLSRRRENLKLELGKNIGRAEMWKVTHKRKNGTYVNDEAMEIGEKIDELMLKNPETASEISPNDPIGVIFGKEHLGRVRGLSYGACPTLAFQQSTTRIRGINFASPNAASPHDKDKFVKIEMNLQLSRTKCKHCLPILLLKKMFQNMLLQWLLAPDIESGVPSPHEILGSSGGSKTP
ncbi:putative transposase [Vigna unguiculata]|uniref:Putative transposase n=1 Tax=Vigna unguiculata TaxID=3917 RepID=A0A4D6LK94_VIGUN|nr:putative transposase [Vigna unguiculata]